MPDANKVLIIEDDPTTLEMLKQYLTFHGFEVEGALTGMQGLQQASSFGPQVLILDLMLPDMDGLVVLKLLRGRVETRDLPVLILSALGSPQSVRSGYEAGATRYLKKPIDMDVLVKEVREAVVRGTHAPPAPNVQQRDAELKPKNTDDDVDFIITPKRRISYNPDGDDTLPL